MEQAVDPGGVPDEGQSPSASQDLQSNQFHFQLEAPPAYFAYEQPAAWQQQHSASDPSPPAGGEQAPAVTTYPQVPLGYSPEMSAYSPGFVAVSDPLYPAPYVMTPPTNVPYYIPAQPVPQPMGWVPPPRRSTLLVTFEQPNMPKRSGKKRKTQEPPTVGPTEEPKSVTPKKEKEDVKKEPSSLKKSTKKQKETGDPTNPGQQAPPPPPPAEPAQRASCKSQLDMTVPMSPPVDLSCLTPLGAPNAFDISDLLAMPDLEDDCHSTISGSSDPLIDGLTGFNDVTSTTSMSSHSTASELLKPPSSAVSTPDNTSTCGGQHEDYNEQTQDQDQDSDGADMPSDPSAKRMRRMMKNRQSAQSSRERKKKYVETLEGQMNQVNDMNHMLSQQVSALTAENYSLRQEVNTLRHHLALTQQQIPYYQAAPQHAPQPHIDVNMSAYTPAVPAATPTSHIPSAVVLCAVVILCGLAATMPHGGRFDPTGTGTFAVDQDGFGKAFSSSNEPISAGRPGRSLLQLSDAPSTSPATGRDLIFAPLQAPTVPDGSCVCPKPPACPRPVAAVSVPVRAKHPTGGTNDSLGADHNGSSSRRDAHDDGVSLTVGGYLMIPLERLRSLVPQERLSIIRQLSNVIAALYRGRTSTSHTPTADPTAQTSLPVRGLPAPASLTSRDVVVRSDSTMSDATLVLPQYHQLPSSQSQPSNGGGPAAGSGVNSSARSGAPNNASMNGTMATIPFRVLEAQIVRSLCALAFSKPMVAPRKQASAVRNQSTDAPAPTAKVQPPSGAEPRAADGATQQLRTRDAGQSNPGAVNAAPNSTPPIGDGQHEQQESWQLPGDVLFHSVKLSPFQDETASMLWSFSQKASPILMYFMVPTNTGPV